MHAAGGGVWRIRIVRHSPQGNFSGPSLHTGLTPPHSILCPPSPLHTLHPLPTPYSAPPPHSILCTPSPLPPPCVVLPCTSAHTHPPCTHPPCPSACTHPPCPHPPHADVVFVCGATNHHSQTLHLIHDFPTHTSHPLHTPHLRCPPPHASSTTFPPTHLTPHTRLIHDVPPHTPHPRPPHTHTPHP